MTSWAGEADLHVGLALAQLAGEGKKVGLAKKSKNRDPDQGERSGSRGNAGGGDPHFSTLLRGQRITVALQRRNRTSCYQGVRWAVQLVT